MAAIASAVLLRLAFPPFGNADAAFFALAPLLIALRAATPRAGFRLGMIFGIVFRISSLSWLCALKDNGGPLALVILGYSALSVYTALYGGLFGWLSARLWGYSRRDGLPYPAAFRAAAWLSEPILWAGCEYLVGSLLSGFPWNPVAASQTSNLPLLSLVSIGGAQLLSALVVAVNSGIASVVARIWTDTILPRFSTSIAPRRHSRLPRTIPLAFALMLLVAAWWHGIGRVRALERSSAAAPQWRIALVHPDAPCIFERDDAAVAESNEALLSLTSLASATSPDLVVWPETSLPGVVPYDRDAANLIREACLSSGAPLLAGGVEYLPRFKGDPDGLLFNSAFLFDEAPSIMARYRKRHLVPFGEFIPLESKIPLLKRLAPTGFSCEPGMEIAIFKVDGRMSSTNGHSMAAAPLICFEDVFPQLSRDCARSGAELLVSIANDAWFDGTSEPEQHLRQAILRAAETGLPMIRSTNRGVTAFILPSGKVIRRIGSGNGSGTPGFCTAEIGIRLNPENTPYVRHGDTFFAQPAAGLAVALSLFVALRRRRRVEAPWRR